MLCLPARVTTFHKKLWTGLWNSTNQTLPKIGKFSTQRNVSYNWLPAKVFAEKADEFDWFQNIKKYYHMVCYLRRRIDAAQVYSLQHYIQILNNIKQRHGKKKGTWQAKENQGIPTDLRLFDFAAHSSEMHSRKKVRHFDEKNLPSQM